jgi:hypothetical protein
MLNGRSPSAKRSFVGFNPSPKSSNFGVNLYPYRDAPTEVRRAQQSSPETSSSEKFSDNGSDDQVEISAAFFYGRNLRIFVVS